MRVPSPNAGQKVAMLTVLELFDADRNGDASALSLVFTENAQMQRVSSKDGQPILTPASSVQGFIDYVEKSGKTKVHDEPVWDYVINVDGNLAQVWVKYAFFFGDEFHHCGEENFLLFRTDRWRIFHLVDTSHPEAHEVPREVLEGAGRL